MLIDEHQPRVSHLSFPWIALIDSKPAFHRSRILTLAQEMLDEGSIMDPSTFAKTQDCAGVDDGVSGIIRASNVMPATDKQMDLIEDLTRAVDRLGSMSSLIGAGEG